MFISYVDLYFSFFGLSLPGFGIKGDGGLVE